MELTGRPGEAGLSAQENTDKLTRRTAIDFITFVGLDGKKIKLKRTCQLSFKEIPGK